MNSCLHFDSIFSISSSFTPIAPNVSLSEPCCRCRGGCRRRRCGGGGFAIRTASWAPTAISTTQNGNNLNTYEINNSVLEITETSNINLNRDIFSKLVRIVNPSNHKTSKFFIPSKNQEIALNDLEAKIIHSYKDKNGDIYYFISGNKFYIVKN